jgi:hypothetical protein
MRGDCRDNERATRVDRTAAEQVTPDAVWLAPAPPDSVPMRPPARAWGMVVTAVRLTDTAGPPVRYVGDPPALDPTRTDTADLVAGVWLPAPPPAPLHHGDVVVRLRPPAEDDSVRADVEVLAATPDGWRTVDTLEALDARWPHHIAMTVLVWMRYLTDAAYQDAQWTALAGPIAAHLIPAGLLPDDFAERVVRDPAVRPNAPDALAALIDAGLIEIGEQVVWNGHTATVGEGGVLTPGDEPTDPAVSTVSALAMSLAGTTTVNGWHLWCRARDNRPLAELRAELANR